MAYIPIEDYGIIGNMRTAALCGKNGSIDWYCYPHFDSPSIFAAILDDEKGGRFQISPVTTGAAQKQFYWPDTNVLVTRFLCPEGVSEITDYMPIGTDRSRLVRTVRVIHGQMGFTMRCEPAFNYARDRHETHVNDQGAAFHAPGLSLGLAATIPLDQTERGVRAEFTLSEDEAASFNLHQIETGGECCVTHSEQEAERLFQQTVDYWRRWIAQCTYTGRWREIIYRSALALKLMIFEPTGAIVAAPTTSLPEGIGGTRNWDYRYAWLRDSGFTAYGLMRIGFMDEAFAFMEWLQERCYNTEKDYPLQPLYGIDGSTEVTEEILDHLEGYRGSSPVRIGNAAYQQFQLDVYGAVMDAVYLYNKYGSFISYDLWSQLSPLMDWVCEHWQRKDLGIWEVRSGPEDFVYSKIMCWVALDRALRIADKRSFPAHREYWANTRDKIYEEVIEKGWNEDRQAFVQHYGSDALDASILINPLVFFTSADEPRMLKTIDALMQSPSEGGLTSGSMVYRYNVEESPDGVSGEPEGTFNMCTFWLVEALTRAGRLDEARLIFERMLSNANHLGLYAEQTGMSGEALGNFPQAFTHLSLISAAYNLDRKLERR